MRETLQSILDTVAPGIDLSSVDPESDLRQALDIDSFDFLRLMQGLESRLGLTIPESDYPLLVTLSALERYLETHARPNG